MELIAAGEPLLGVAELERSYAAMPDPLGHRAGRGKVLGSLRSALNEQYRATGDPSHLRRLQGHLLRHLEALLAALGSDATPDDAAGTLRALGEVAAALARHPPLVEPVVMATPVTAKEEAAPKPRAPVEGPRTAADERGGRRRRAVGAGLLGVGAATWIGTLVAAAIYADRYGRVHRLTEKSAGRGTSPSVAEVLEVRGLQHESQTARVAAFVTAGVGGVLALAGVGLLVSERQARRGLRLTPRVSGGGYGLWLEGRF